jgi:23S rRNA (uracil1939-C5)-methyltransferase
VTHPLPLPPPGARLVLSIDGVDDEGRGRAVVDDEEGREGYDVAVRGGAPGDRVEAVVERVWATRRLLQARRTKLLEAGDAHEDSPCPHGPPCAGCPLEGWQPEAAIAFKVGRLQQALDEAGLAFALDPPLLGERWYGRRQRSKLTAAVVKGHLRLGLYAPHSHRLLDATGCPHLRPELLAALEEVSALLDEAPPETQAVLKAVTVRAFLEGVAVVLVAGAPVDDLTFYSLAALVDDGRLASLSVRVDERGGNSLVGGRRTRGHGPDHLMPLEGGPAVDVDSFCQPDPELAMRMVEAAATFLAEGGTGGWALDGYAGSGAFGRGLREAGFATVVAVESAGQHKVALSDSGLLPVVQTMEEALEQLATRGPPTAVVVDPPRKGLAAAAAPLAALMASRLVLVSCDPDAMARDLSVLIASGYRVARCVPVDLFGGAAAIEAMTFLMRDAPAS